MGEWAFHPDADADYRRALAWYRAHRPRLADRLAAELKRACEAAVANPRLFPVFDGEIRHVRFRRLPFFLAYLPTEAGIFIVGVAHTSRDEQSWLDRA